MRRGFELYECLLVDVVVSVVAVVRQCSKTIQSTCSAYGGGYDYDQSCVGYDYDQSWVCVL